MKLTRLELSGFKSFADSVPLEFYDGVTAIVGPNGCGKSNISDAVRWVLGEQRARLLRSARMDEVIFQGSVKRHPINIAEVSLVFDNSEGLLTIPYREVVLTRRLTRTGQSEYLLNQTPVRLRDVADLLQGTGLGSDAGVVMEAQMIDRLLSDRTEERRSLFEEAAGIGLYRNRKESTERRLERTAADLQRLDDVIGEVQTQVRSLARQKGRTERHRTYTMERFAIVMTLARRDLARFEERHASLRSRRDELRTRVPDLRRSLTEAERTREVRAQERSAAEARRNELERHLGQARIEIERLEGDLKVADERREQATQRREKAVEERSQVETRLAQIERELEAVAAERHAAREARDSVQTELDLRAASEGEARARLTAHREAVRSLEEALQRATEGIRALQGEYSALERELEDTRQRETELGAHTADTARQMEEARARNAEAREALHARESEEREASADLERARHTVAAAREQEAAIRVDRREIQERMAQQRARREALAELERRREGLAPGVQALLLEADRFGTGAIVGPLSDFLSISTGEARLTERLLGDWLQAVLVRDESTVSEVRRWHEATGPGPLVLLPLRPGPSVPSGRAPSRVPFDVAPEAEPWVGAILDGVEAGDAEGSLIRRANGAVFLPGGGVSGPLSRRAELDELARTIADGTRRLDDLTRAMELAAAAHAAAEHEIEAATERSGRARAALREAQGAADDAGRSQMRAERAHGEAEQALQRLVQRIEERNRRLHAVVEEVQDGEGDRAKNAEQLKAQLSTLLDLESAQEAARELRVQWQVEEVQVSAREQAAAGREERGRSALAEATDEISSLRSELADIEHLVESVSSQQREWHDTLAERRVAVEQMQDAVGAAETATATAHETLVAAERGVDETRRTVEALSEELHRVELELTEAEGRRQGLIERIEGEWHKPITELFKEVEEVDGDTDALRAEAVRLAEELERIGPVNLLAVEEHTEESKRVEFLTSQRDDLVAARDSLLQALKEIEVTARDMFLETFGAVRENFHSVFKTLFEGGECDVFLADQDDPLGSDIVINAAPRGKRTQRIHLLSTGERALVAISLLFAIYLTKPAPFCLLDEVDAPLDDANVMRFVRLLDGFKADTQFIVITHNPRTMQVADAVYGVTMQEPGVSTIVGVRLGETEQSVA
jgi:chromosome segregation protein